jgi:hypothetical protein
MNNERFTVGDGFRLGLGFVLAQIFVAFVVSGILIIVGTSLEAFLANL